MIDLKTLSAEWIAEKRKKYSKDTTLMESMIYALYLLEQLQLSGLDFIFKGGTSLILLMKEPKRFSVDIDIIISPKISREELEKYLSEIEKKYPKEAPSPTFVYLWVASIDRLNNESNPAGPLKYKLKN